MPRDKLTRDKLTRDKLRPHTGQVETASAVPVLAPGPVGVPSSKETGPTVEDDTTGPTVEDETAGPTVEGETPRVRPLSSDVHRSLIRVRVCTHTHARALIHAH